VSRLVLLSPAGFQASPPLLSYPFILLVPAWTWILDNVVSRWRPGAGLRFTLPTSPLRHVTFKLTHDLQHLPAVQELARSFMRACMSGDTSAWDRALQLPHYSARSMPCLSVHMGNHLCQWIKSGKFQLYDYGGGAGPGSNAARYGTPAPPDVASMYALLDDVPVDIVGGRADGVVAAANCERHVAAMAGAGVDVRYVEFPGAGHMDFVLSSKDDVRTHVLKTLLEKGR
jgi:lysosomal acid lipase/cholesteryl ester hydrolase